MAKIRVGQLAKQLDLKVADLLVRLRELGAEVKSNLSTVDDEVAARLRSAAPSAGEGPADGPAPTPPVKQPKTAKAVSKTGARAQSAREPAGVSPIAPKPASPPTARTPRRRSPFGRPEAPRGPRAPHVRSGAATAPDPAPYGWSTQPGRARRHEAGGAAASRRTSHAAPPRVARRGAAP